MQRLQTRLGEFFGLFQARLSLRIVGWIFLSLVAIESVLLVPSVEQRKQELLQQYLQQVDRVTTAAAAVERGDFQLDALTEVASRPDELGQLARMFQQMAQQIQQREEQLRQQLVELKIEIDQKKRQKEVAILTESSYFQEVQQEVASLNLDEFWS